MAINLYPGGDAPVTVNYGLALYDMTYEMAENFITIDANLGAGGGAVSSVFGRTGAILAQAGDYSAFYIPASTVLPGSAGPTAHEWLASYNSLTGAFTISQPAASDLSNGVTGSGAVVLASAIAGFGTGTVTSFSSGNLSPLFTSSVSTATTTPALTYSASTAAQNSLLAGPSSGGTGAYSFRALTLADMPSGLGTVTNFSFTGGIISVATSTTTPALTVAGTSGGIPYFSSSSAWASSAVLVSGQFLLGGGAGSPPTTSFSVVPIANGGTATGSALTGLVRGGNPFTASEISGDATTSGSNALTLATVNTNVGSFTNASITVNGKGLITAASNGSAGTVSSFSAGNLSPLFTTSVATSTSTPALSFTASTAAQNSVLAGPSTGGTGAYSFRVLVTSDIPSLPYVTSVGFTGDGIVFNTSVTGSPVTSSGTFAPSLVSQNANTVFAGPASGGAAAPSFQTAPTISAANMTSFPTLNQNTTGTAANVTGVVATANGGSWVYIGTDSGSANAYVITTTPALGAYVAGVIVGFVPSAAATGASTINVSGLGNKNLMKGTTSGVAVLSASGDLNTFTLFFARYDGTQFVLINPASMVYTGGALTAGGFITGNSGNQISSNATITVGTGGTVAKYNGISTVNNGIASEIATVDSSLSAAVTATTIYTPAATGRFRVSGSLIITTPASGSSVLGGTTGVVITYTDGTSSVAQSITMSGNTAAGAPITIGTGVTANTTTSQYLLVPVYIFAKISVAIQYAIGYTSVGGTAMVYEAHLVVESM